MPILSPSLTLSEAQAIAEAAIAEATLRSQRICVAILDNHGNDKLLLRMDGSPSGAITIARQKAQTSAALPYSTRRMGERNLELPGGPFSGGAIAGAVLLAGGLPIFDSKDNHLGGIGISGAPPDIDEACAAAGLQALYALT